MRSISGNAVSYSPCLVALVSLRAHFPSPSFSPSSSSPSPLSSFSSTTALMLLLRFPQRMHMSMASVDLPTFSKSSILLSLLASLVVLSAIRAAFLYLRPHALVEKQQAQKLVLVKEKGQNENTSRPRTSSWCWGLLTWESLPTLPVSLKMPDDMKGRGVLSSGGSVEQKQHQLQPAWNQNRRGPAFERPRK